MKNWWRTDEELMKNWWRTDEADEGVMKNWWRGDEEVMKNWWRTDEELLKTTTDYHRLPLTATDWLVLLHWTLKAISGDGWMDGCIPDSTNYKSTACGANKKLAAEDFECPTCSLLLLLLHHPPCKWLPSVQNSCCFPDQTWFKEILGATLLQVERWLMVPRRSVALPQ